MRFPPVCILVVVTALVACGGRETTSVSTPDATAEACTPVPRPASAPPTPASVLAHGGWDFAKNYAGTLEIDVDACEQIRYGRSFGLGSTWIEPVPTAAGCQIWLGGEAENPRYDGTPLAYCLFPRCDKSVLASALYDFPSNALVDTRHCVLVPSPPEAVDGGDF